MHHIHSGANGPTGDGSLMAVIMKETVVAVVLFLAVFVAVAVQISASV